MTEQMKVVARVCTKCGVRKNLSKFNKNSGFLYGVAPSCKICYSQIDKARKKVLRTTDDYKNYHNKKSKAWSKANKEKTYAHNKVSFAIKSGKLVRALKCEDCLLERKTYGHHEDYSKPLKVNWLCVDCHEKRHHKF